MFLDYYFIYISPHVVHCSYNIVLSLVMQGYFPSRSAVSKFRAEAVYNEFMKQWNLGVYFSLRYSAELFRFLID